jgi:hypothetical protein
LAFTTIDLKALPIGSSYPLRGEQMPISLKIGAYYVLSKRKLKVEGSYPPGLLP